MKKTGFITVLILLAATSHAQVKDTLYFFNHTLLIGELKKISMGKIGFDGDGVGIVKIKFDKIKTIKAASHFYRVETSGRKLYYGTIDSSGNAGRCFIVSGDGRSELKLSNITFLSFYHNYDRKSPATNAPKTDYGFVAGINYEF